ncbi:MAG: aldo/keto reductase [Candidatus Brocadiia bacterium]
MEDLEKVEKFKPLAQDRSLAQLSLQFVLSHPAVTTVIPGAKTKKQVKKNTRAMHLPPLADEELDEINEITPPGGGRKIWPA